MQVMKKLEKPIRGSRPVKAEQFDFRPKIKDRPRAGRESVNYHRRDESSRNSIMVKKPQERSGSCVPQMQSNDHSLSLLDQSQEEIKVFLGSSTIDPKLGRDHPRPYKQRREFFSKVSTLLEPPTRLT